MLQKGWQFKWMIPKISTYSRSCILDSAIAESFEGVGFHFHFCVGAEGDVGFYIHYKHAPIPKYSYFFASTNGSKTRQHTGHTIPPDTEKCGHWNMCSHADLQGLVEASQDDTLIIYFRFDNDILTSTGFEELRVEWTIPGITSLNLSPLSSHGFSFNGFTFVLRIDSKEETDELMVFMFCKKGSVNIPPHSLVVVTSEGVPLGSFQHSDATGAKILRVNRSQAFTACGPGAMKIFVTLKKGGNPLHMFDMARGAQASQQPADEAEPAPTRSPRKGQPPAYALINEDDV